MTLQHYLAAAGQSPDKAQAWENLIIKVAEKTEADVEKLSGIILRTLVAGKTTGESCNQLQELGIPLSDNFKNLVAAGNATNEMLGIALTTFIATGNHE